MLVIYRVAQRGREAMTVLPKQRDMSKPKLQVSTAIIPFAGMGYGLSDSPTIGISIRGCDSPYTPLPPPYDFPVGTFPQSPTAKPAHMSPVQKLGIK